MRIYTPSEIEKLNNNPNVVRVKYNRQIEYKNEFKKWTVIQSYKYPELSAIQIFELAGFDRKIISSKNARDRLNYWKGKYKNIKLESKDDKSDKQDNIVLLRLLTKTEDLLSILNKKL